ncbi:hypothetical protein Tsubulata_029366 [Turnera subulata]|uniref:RING-type domain-containing protein n=1 Tax=Turnera subulata TaxID=218843 RepID=A0A9Q0F3F0_9ROSI|nr:hypothetical protein Tsubulata_029366 [Turnera subulata]
MDGTDGGEEELSSSGVSCSICLDTVLDNGGRSRAKLQCGHEFHLDCIGSAFNMKGAMQCPNCRKIEKGQWLYANGSARSSHELGMEDWIPDEEFYDPSFPEMPYRVHWCPFAELDRIGSYFEEVESPSSTYHDLRSQHSMYGEPTAAPSVAHSYVAYVGPIPPSSSRSIDGAEDPNFNHQWRGVSGRSEFISPHAFPAINIHYHSWARHSSPFSVPNSHINGVDRVPAPLTLRSSGEAEARPRSTASPHPILFNHGSGPSAGNSFVSSMVPHHARTHERIQISHAFYPRQQPGNSPVMHSPTIHGIRRLDGPRGLPGVMPPPAPHDHGGGFFFVPPGSSGPPLHETDSPLRNHFHPWERDHLSRFPHVSFGRESGWSSFEFQRNTGAVDSGDRMSSFWRRHPS